MEEMVRIPAVLIGLNVNNQKGFEKSLAEMKALAEAGGFEVLETFVQSLPRVNTGYYIGSGKIQEIKAYLEMSGAQTVLADSQLTPMQLRNLGDAFDCEVLDRTALILRIFSERARTREANLQVEYARLEYMLPRLAGLHSELGRQAGTSGSMSSRGAGEKKIELDRRHIEARMAELRRELEEVNRERTTQRSRRLRTGLPRVSLVGYTNAGKSTVLNGMLRAFGGDEGKQVFEEDMLFATLDTTVRRIEPGNDRKPFLLSDTVGFIDRLPTTLVKAFRSTLEEAKFADVLVIVSDISDPKYRENLEVTVRTLTDIGAGGIPRLYVFNKADKVTDFRSDAVSVPCITGADARITISAKSPADIERLADAIGKLVNAGRYDCELLIPYDQGGILNALKERSDLTILDYAPEGTRVRALLSPEDFARYQTYVTQTVGQLDR